MKIKNMAVVVVSVLGLTACGTGVNDARRATDTPSQLREYPTLQSRPAPRPYPEPVPEPYPGPEDNRRNDGKHNEPKDLIDSFEHIFH